MSNDTPPDSQDNQTPPPSGDFQKASKYIETLVELINQDKITVNHTDLSKFDPSALQDHYRIDLEQYQVEVSHSKHPNNGKDSYVILFNNLQKVKDECLEKVILAYMHLDDEQFNSFKLASASQADRKKKLEEEKRLNQIMQPIDQILDDLSSAKPS